MLDYKSYITRIIPAAETIDKVKMSFLDWLVSEDTARQSNYRSYREYYDGNHDTQLTDRMAKFLQVKTGEEFNCNYCPIVVDALAERLTVTGFELEDDEQRELLWGWWNDNRMDANQGIIHTSAIRDGDTYLIVEWDNEKEKPIFTAELAYDGTEGVKVHYQKDKRNQIEFASKRWRIEQGQDAGYVRRLNLYYPDRIERYISDQRANEGNWREYVPDGEESHIAWWTDIGTEAGNPLGVPVIHFKNKDQGYNYGKSELVDIIPVQNALNKTLIDLLASADTTAFRIFWMIGDDPTSINLVPGSWVYSERPPGGEDGASVGYFPGEDLSPIIALKDSIVIEIARISRTPLSYFQISGHRAAEGTLKQEESGLIARAKNRQITFGNAWEDAVNMARRLNNAFGNKNELDLDIPLSTQWADPETRNEKEHIEAIALKREKLRIPLEQTWLEAGYSPDEIERMKNSDEYQARLNMLQIGMLENGNRARTGSETSPEDT